MFPEELQKLIDQLLHIGACQLFPLAPGFWDMVEGICCQCHGSFFVPRCQQGW